MICIHHSRDLDGWTSGAIVRLKYPKCKLIGYDYGQPFPWDRIKEAEPIIMSDVSLPMEDMQRLSAMSGDLVWIDHHISAIKDYEGVKRHCDFTAFLDNNISACEATWKYMFPDTEMPQAVKLLGEYDTWRNQYRKHWVNMVLPFQFGMRIQCDSVESFPIHLFDDDSKDVIEVIKYGNVILKYQEQINRHQCKRSFEFTFESLRAIAHNAGGFNSDMFKSVYDQSKHDIMVMFQYDGKTKNWIFSLYSDKPEVDCSVLAKRFGGGGHKGAAGFQIDHLDSFFISQKFKQAANV